LSLLQKWFDKLVKSTRKEISIDYIQKIVCEYFGLPI